MAGKITVRVKLYARLDRYLPQTRAERDEADLEVTTGTTVGDVFRRLKLPPEVCHLVLVNGHFLVPGDRETRALQNGDHLAVWPPVAGGADQKNPAGGAGEKKSAIAADAEKPPSDDKSRTVIAKEMAVTRDDFFRTLPRALADQPFKKTGNRVVVEDKGKGKRLDISLGPERTRQIAGLKVPASDVTLTFTGYDKTEIAAALRQFERRFQKGGG